MFGIAKLLPKFLSNTELNLGTVAKSLCLWLFDIELTSNLFLPPGLYASRDFILAKARDRLASKAPTERGYWYGWNGGSQPAGD